MRVLSDVTSKIQTTSRVSIPTGIAALFNFCIKKTTTNAKTEKQVSPQGVGKKVDEKNLTILAKTVAAVVSPFVQGEGGEFVQGSKSRRIHTVGRADQSAISQQKIRNLI